MLFDSDEDFETSRKEQHASKNELRWEITHIGSDVSENTSLRRPRHITWMNENEFLFCVTGYVVGLGNVAKFPYLCYKHGGGGVFFIPYIICIFFLGIPFLLFEFTIGQLSAGMIEYWLFCPLLRGVEYVCFLSSLCSAIYYAVIVSWTVLYLTYCFEAKIPWKKCREPWATPICADYIRNVDRANCTGNITFFENGTCYDMRDGKLYGIYNETLARANGLQKDLPAEDFLNYESLKRGESSGLDDIGPLQWRICLCLALTWVIVLCCLIKGIRTIGKVAYFTSALPLILVIILIINACTMKGSGDGLKYYLYLDVHRLNNFEVWQDAALHTIYSLGLFRSCLPALASHNRFRHNVVRSAFFVAFVDTAASFVGGVAVFTCTGVFAHQMNAYLHDLPQSDLTLAFIVYPQALSILPFPRFWNIAFFLMVFCLTCFAQLVLFETTVIDLIRYSGIPKKVRLKTSIGVCLVMYLIGLTMAAPSATYVMGFFYIYPAELFALFGLFVGTVAVSIYGSRRFSDDIESMVGPSPLFCIPWKYLRWYFIVSWGAVSPFLMLLILNTLIFDSRNRRTSSRDFPVWAVALGWLINIIPVVILISTIVWDMRKTKGTCFKRFSDLLKPHKYFNTCRTTIQSEESLTGGEIFTKDMDFVLRSHKEMPEDTCTSDRHFRERQRSERFSLFGESLEEAVANLDLDNEVDNLDDLGKILAERDPVDIENERKMHRKRHVIRKDGLSSRRKRRKIDSAPKRRESRRQTEFRLSLMEGTGNDYEHFLDDASDSSNPAHQD